MFNIIDSVDDFYSKYNKYIKIINHNDYTEYKILCDKHISDIMYTDIYNRLINNNMFESVDTIVYLDDDSIFLAVFIGNILELEVSEILIDYKKILLICTYFDVNKINKILENKNIFISGIFSVIRNINLELPFKIKYLINPYNKYEYDIEEIKYNNNNSIYQSQNDSIIVFSTKNLLSLLNKLCNINNIFKYGNINILNMTINCNIYNKNILFLLDMNDFKIEFFYILKYISCQKIKNLMICIFYYPLNNNINKISKYSDSIYNVDSTQIIWQLISELNKNKKTDILMYDNYDHINSNLTIHPLDNTKHLVNLLENTKFVLIYASEKMYERYKNIFKNNVQIIYNKELNKTISNDNAIIIDNTIDNGTKIFEIYKDIKKYYKQISVYVDHPNFLNDSYVEFLKGGLKEGLYRFYTTDSIPNISNKLPEPFYQILSIIPTIYNDIINICGDDLLDFNKFTIHLADISISKKKYVQNAIKCLEFKSSVIRPYNIKYDDEDTFDSQTICKTAIKRFQKIINYGNEYDYHISIENCMIIQNNKNYNVTCIIINKGTNEQKIFWTDFIEIPDEIINNPEIEQIVLEDICGITNEKIISNKLINIFSLV